MIKLKVVLISMILIVSSLSSCTKEEITLGILLKEMTDRTSLAHFPSPAYTTRQFSSYDRSTSEPGNPSWFANWDRSQFIRTDTVDGRREFVIFDAEGPGAVVRFWATVADYSDHGILRFYFDGKQVPEIEGELLQLISGGALVGAPLSGSVAPETEYKQRGHNLYLPVPYSKSLKITYESPGINEPGKNSGENFYYNINYRTYQRGTRVESFTMAGLKMLADEIAATQRLLLETPDVDPDWNVVASENDEINIAGPGAIRELSVKLTAADLPQALRSTVLTISFDGQECVSVPVGEFFGTGNRFHSFSTFYSSVDLDSVMRSYWVMPFKNKCDIKLVNVRNEVVTAEMQVAYSDWKWNSRTMYFGAGWTEYQQYYTGRYRHPDGTDSQTDVNFVTLTGKGIYVGDVLTLYNPVADWWGEGDEKVFVDGETFPSHIGTGTEDYYGYAWCMHPPFDHPFIAQPDGSGATSTGHVANLRYRSLDAVPFTKSLVFDMEMWHWTSTHINYAPATFWYMLPGGESNRKTDPELAAVKVVTQKNELVSDRPDDKGVVEGEFCGIELTGGVDKSQSLDWLPLSNGAQFFWRDASDDHRATMTFTMSEAGNYRLKIHHALARDYGKFKVLLNDKILIPVLDLYAESIRMELLDAGKVSLSEGVNRLTFVQLERNPKSINNFLGVDYLLIEALP